MAEKSLPPLILLTGPAGSGKSTLCRLFLNRLEEASVLVIDPSPDAYLALCYGVASPITLEALLKEIDGQPATREGIDWALQDLPVAIGSNAEAEVLVLGKVPETLNQNQETLMNYGLPRLFAQYDLILMDGKCPAFERLIPPSIIRPFLVITPDDDVYCQQASDDKAVFVLSKAEASDDLPPTAKERIAMAQWKFLGKLPPVHPPEKRVRELPEHFDECLNKLDLPLELRTHLSPG